jgi:hypothetical protein
LLLGAPKRLARLDGAAPPRSISRHRLMVPADRQHRKEIIVLLIAHYVAFMIAGDLAAYAIGLVTELEFGGHVSLVVFLVLYFLFLWVSWILAVWLTKPKHVEPANTKAA